MITRMDNGCLHVLLGEGTVYTGVISKDGIPVGVGFSNSTNKTLDENSIFLQMTSEKAMVSYMDLMMRYFTELLKMSDQDSEELEALKGNIDEFRASVQHLMPKREE